MTKATGKPKGRPPGRPRGSRDFRPHLLNLLEKFRLIPLLLGELVKLRDSLPPEERVKLYMEMARMGLSASPRTVEGDAGGMSVNIILTGITGKTVSAEAVDVSPPLEQAVPAASLPEAREAAALRERHYPLPPRRGRAGIPVAVPEPVDAAEEKRQALIEIDRITGRCIPPSIPDPWNTPLPGPKLYIP